MDAPLLATKLRIPPRRGELVPRTRLLAQLDQGLAQKLTLVSAPAGFGKTTLVAEWAAACRQEKGMAVGWLALDSGDNDLARFLNYLCAALTDAAPVLVDEIAPLLRSPHRPAPEEAVATLINHLVAASTAQSDREEGERRFLLVLDDYHLITAPDVHQALSFLLEHQPTCLHLVLITRADPPLPIPRLRSQGQLLEIRQSALRFSEREAFQFLQAVMAITLSESEARTLTTRTEGWVAGLQMAALALRGRPLEETGDFVAGFTGTHRYVLDYLLEEVLQRQPQEVQQFLLQTSILERLNAPLCDHLLAGGEQGPTSIGAPQSHKILDYLDSHNLFLVPLDEQRRWYRYHRLFSDLLRLRLEQSMPALLPVLHERAAHWYQVQGEVTAAIDHFLAGGNAEAATVLVASSAESVVMRGEVMTLLRWINALPEVAVRQRPHLALLYAWALLIGGGPAERVEYWLRTVEAQADKAGWAAAIRSYIQLFQGEPDAARQLAEQALATLPPEAVFLNQLAALVHTITVRYQDEEADSEQAFAAASQAGAAVENALVAVFGLCMRADLVARRGDLASAKAIYEQALQMAKGEGSQPLPLASEPLLGLATLALERFELAETERLLAEGLAHAHQWSGVAALDGHLLQSRLHYFRGEYQQMWSQIEKAEAIARRYDAIELDDLIVAASRTQKEIVLGHLEPARRWLEKRAVQAEKASSDLAHDSSPLRKYEYLLLARLRLAEGRAEEAEALLQTLLPHFDRLRAQISIYVVQALAAEQQGNLEQALSRLAKALAQAEAAGLVAVFVEEGETVAHLLYRALEANIAPAFVGRLLGAFPMRPVVEKPPAAEVALVEPLSEREVEVLALVAEGLTNQEIADRLFLSLATVKWHTSNIYGKLAVNNRTEAVTRAQALGLLPLGGPWPQAAT